MEVNNQLFSKNNNGVPPAVPSGTAQEEASEKIQQVWSQIDETSRQARQQVQAVIDGLQGRIRKLEAALAEKDLRIEELEALVALKKPEVEDVASDYEGNSIENSLAEEPLFDAARAQRIFNLAVMRSTQYGNLPVHNVIERLEKDLKTQNPELKEDPNIANKMAGASLLKQILTPYKDDSIMVPTALNRYLNGKEKNSIKDSQAKELPFDLNRAQRIFSLAVMRSAQYGNISVDNAIERISEDLLDYDKNPEREKGPTHAEEMAGARLLKQILTPYKGKYSPNHQAGHHLKVPTALNKYLSGQR